VLDSDAVVHELYERDDVRQAVIARLGQDVAAPDGSIDRRAVARRIFPDEALRTWLEQLIHPLVGEVLAWWVAEQRALDPPPRALVHEVQLLFEADLAGRYDRTLVIAADPALRRARIAGRGGLDRIAEREARMVGEEEKRARANDVIVNDGDLAELDRAVAAYLDRIGC
jgi:dephospho-CoA kinase